MADGNTKSAVIKAAEQTLGHKTRQEVRKDGDLTSPSTLQIILRDESFQSITRTGCDNGTRTTRRQYTQKKNKITKDNQNVPSGKQKHTPKQTRIRQDRHSVV